MANNVDNGDGMDVATPEVERSGSVAKSDFSFKDTQERDSEASVEADRDINSKLIIVLKKESEKQRFVSFADVQAGSEEGSSSHRQLSEHNEAQLKGKKFNLTIDTEYEDYPPAAQNVDVEILNESPCFKRPSMSVNISQQTPKIGDAL